MPHPGFDIQDQKSKTIDERAYVESMETDTPVKFYEPSSASAIAQSSNKINPEPAFLQTSATHSERMTARVVAGPNH